MYINIKHYNRAKPDISLSSVIKISSNISDPKISYLRILTTRFHTFLRFKYLNNIRINLRYD